MNRKILKNKTIQQLRGFLRRYLQSVGPEDIRVKEIRKVIAEKTGKKYRYVGSR